MNDIAEDTDLENNKSGVSAGLSNALDNVADFTFGFMVNALRSITNLNAQASNDFYAYEQHYQHENDGLGGVLKRLFEATTEIKDRLNLRFSEEATPSKISADLEIRQGRTTLTSKRSDGSLSAKEIYAMIKSTAANKPFVENGIPLTITDGNGHEKAHDQITDIDVKNLALTYAAAKKQGLSITNESDIQSILNKHPEIAATAQHSMSGIYLTQPPSKTEHYKM